MIAGWLVTVGPFIAPGLFLLLVLVAWQACRVLDRRFP